MQKHGTNSYTLFLRFSWSSPFLDLPIASHTGNLPNPGNDPEPLVPGWMQEGAEALLGRAVHTKEEPLVDSRRDSGSTITIHTLFGYSAPLASKRLYLLA